VHELASYAARGVKKTLPQVRPVRPVVGRFGSVRWMVFVVVELRDNQLKLG
jgi:hypothetical protein